MKRSLGIIFKQILLMLFMYFIFRLIFLLNNEALFREFTFSELLPTFVVGVRFDLSAILMINAWFYIAQLLLPVSWWNGWVWRLFTFCYVILNLGFIFVNVGDSEYFNFTGRRVSWDIFHQAPEVGNQFWQMAGYYWKHMAAILTLIVLFVWVQMRWLIEMAVDRPRHSDRPGIIARLKHYALSLGTVLVTLVFMVIGARGGLQLKPLQTINAFVFDSSQLSILALNSSFTMVKSYQQKSLKMKTYFASRSEVLKHLPDQTEIDGQLEPTREAMRGANGAPMNLVIIVLESFSSEYMGAGNPYQGFTPFLDNLAEKGLFFKNHFANGRRSIEAIPAILAGIPSLMNEPFVNSKFLGNRWIGLGKILEEEGYETSFFHGGENGTMFFDRFSSQCGFKSYFGFDQYPDQLRDSDGNWGIYDGPYFDYYLQKLSEFSQPFASLIFSLSSHQPYLIPKASQGIYPKGSLEIHESVGYADNALKSFFAQAEKQSWFANTLFIITADHTQKSNQPKYASPLGQFRVPLIFYSPGVNLPEYDPTRVTSHLDVMPSVLDLFGIANPIKWPFGRSVFSDDDGGLVVNLMAGGAFLATRGTYIEMTSEGQIKPFHYGGDLDLRSMDPNSEDAKKWALTLKAYLQLYINGMVKNNWAL